MTTATSRPTLLSRANSHHNWLTLWCPLIVTLSALIASVVVSEKWGFTWVAQILSYTFFGLLVYFVILILIRLFQRRWVSAFAAFLCIICSILTVFPVVILSLVDDFLDPGPSEDGFADNLTIPNNISFSEPLQWPPVQANVTDEFQTAVLSSLAVSDDGNQVFNASCENLSLLSHDSPSLLERFLATHPGWRVFQENGTRFATRRWAIKGGWRYELHGYYSDFDIRQSFASSNGPRFQSRLTLGLDGVPWVERNSSTTAKLGDDITPILGMGNGMHESHIVLSDNGIVIELFEQSFIKERRISKAALAFIHNELSPLTTVANWESYKTTLDPTFTRRGEADLALYASFQPGIYDAYLWANPGEPGMVYLKAYEVTQAYQLSESRLRESSNEWIGWSDDPEELFFSNTHFTIYEGDWGQPYVARFELWFVPDSGQPERKLLEKNFKIEGWMR